MDCLCLSLILHKGKNSQVTSAWLVFVLFQVTPVVVTSKAHKEIRWILDDK